MSSFTDNISNYESDPEESLHTQLKNYTSSGQWFRAREVAGQLLSTSPESSWLHCQMGFILYQLNDFKHAENHLKESVRLQPDYANGYRLLGFLYLSMNRAGTAEDNVRKALSLEPNDETSWCLLGNLSLHFDNPQQALQCAEKALNLCPDDVSALDLKARALDELPDHKVAPQDLINQYEEILSLEPDNALAYSRIGDVYCEKLKKYKVAEEYYRKALFIDPESKSHQSDLIRCLRKRDPILRLLWLPFLPTKLVIKLIELIPDGNLKWKHLFGFLLALPLLLIGKYIILFGIVSAVAFFTFFWPLTKVYEYLTIVDIHKKMGKIAIYKGPFRKLHKWSFYTRFFLFLVFLVCFWSVVYFLFTSDQYRGGTIAAFLTVCIGAVILTVLASCVGILIDANSKKTRERRNKKQPVIDNE
ncbi:tetratricopeptide repeat protein [Rubritalea squalenifaciens]|nr:tetratricopeptide repeat protein [Rubritalea squalenifaciens]